MTPVDRKKECTLHERLQVGTQTHCLWDNHVISQHNQLTSMQEADKINMPTFEESKRCPWP